MKPCSSLPTSVLSIVVFHAHLHKVSPMPPFVVRRVHAGELLLLAPKRVVATSLVIIATCLPNGSTPRSCASRRYGSSPHAHGYRAKRAPRKPHRPSSPHLLHDRRDPMPFVRTIHHTLLDPPPPVPVVYRSRSGTSLIVWDDPLDAFINALRPHHFFRRGGHYSTSSLNNCDRAWLCNCPVWTCARLHRIRTGPGCCVPPRQRGPRTLLHL